MTEIFHNAYYELINDIEKRISEFSDDDLHHAYWLDYEMDGGLFEALIREEYDRRKYKGG